MKQFNLIMLFMFLALAGAAAQSAPSQAAAEISFTFTRQSGSASNQYAIWIEDARGQFIKTIYAARWTAAGGWSRRPTSIPVWVRQSGLSTVPRELIDAVSGATPRTGPLTYTWDGADFRGAAVPPGDYVLIMEGTLRWENQVYYRTPIRIGGGPASLQTSIEYTTGERDTTAERAMFSNVRVRVLR